MNFPEIYSASGMIELIQKIGFLRGEPEGDLTAPPTVVLVQILC